MGAPNPRIWASQSTVPFGPHPLQMGLRAQRGWAACPKSHRRTCHQLVQDTDVIWCRAHGNQHGGPSAPAWLGKGSASHTRSVLRLGESKMVPAIHSFNKRVSSTYYVPDRVLEAWGPVSRKRYGCGWRGGCAKGDRYVGPATWLTREWRTQVSAYPAWKFNKRI